MALGEGPSDGKPARRTVESRDRKQPFSGMGIVFWVLSFSHDSSLKLINSLFVQVDFCWDSVICNSSVVVLPSRSVLDKFSASGWHLQGHWPDTAPRTPRSLGWFPSRSAWAEDQIKVIIWFTAALVPEEHCFFSCSESSPQCPAWGWHPPAVQGSPGASVLPYVSHFVHIVGFASLPTDRDDPLSFDTIGVSQKEIEPSSWARVMVMCS